MKKFFVFVYALAFCLLLFGACHDVNAATVDVSSCTNTFLTYGSNYIATDGAYSVCNTQTKMNNYTGKEYTQYGFTLFSNKANINAYARFKGDGSSDASGFISKGFSEGQITSLKNDYGWTDDEVSYLYNNITYEDNVISVNTQQYSEITPSASADVSIENASFLDIVNAVKSALLNKKTFENVPNADDDMIPPKFYLKTYCQNGMLKYTEYTLTWDTSGSFVEGSENEYGFKLYIATENNPSKSKIMDCTSSYPCLFSSNSISFSWSDVKKLFSIFSTSKLENRFDLFIQITDTAGNPVSDNFIHFLVVKRVEIRASDYVDSDGNVKNSYGKWENGKFDYTDGRETSADDNSTNSNGSSTSPNSNIIVNGYTNIENAPSASALDVSLTNSLLNTLNSISDTISAVPQLLAKVCSWLPNDIIALISCAIGLIVVCGIVKWFL